MATLLNQVIAAEPTAKEHAKRTLAIGRKMTHGKEVRPALHGLIKTYRPYAEEPRPEDQRPDERTDVQVHAEHVLAKVIQDWTSLLDLRFTVESGNAEARADVEIDGHVLLKNAPVTFLLGLEGELGQLLEFLRGLPVLDAGEVWTEDGDQFRSDPVRTQATSARLANHVKWEPPNEKYAQDAQVETYKTDVRVGEYTTTRFSGCMRRERVEELCDRCETLIKATRNARIKANSGEVKLLRAGSPLLRYVASGVYPEK